MNIKDIKKLYLLVTVLILLMAIYFLCFIFNSNRKVFFNPQASEQQVNESLSEEEIEKEYKENLKSLLDDYFKMQEKEDLSFNKVAELQERMMQMTLNEEQKDFHLSLFLLFEDMKKSFTENGDRDIALIQEQVKEEVDQCEWLE